MQYKKGLVSIQNGSNIVVGDADTLWAAGLTTPGGMLFGIPNQTGTYYVQGVNGDGNVVLTSPWEGDDLEGSTYWLTRDFTPIMGLPLAQPFDLDATKVIERAFIMLDQAVTGVSGGIFAVQSRTTVTPPASPTDGAAYIVPASGATGVWVGYDNKIAVYRRGAWMFYQPANGFWLKVNDEFAFYFWNGPADEWELNPILNDGQDYALREPTPTDNGIPYWDHATLTFKTAGGYTLAGLQTELANRLRMDAAQVFTSDQQVQGRANLGLVIGTDVQAHNANLDAVAGVASAADNIPYFTGAGTAAVTAFTGFGRTLAGLANANAGRIALALIIGTNVQAWNPNLDSLSALGTAADKIAYTGAANTWLETPLTIFGRTLIGSANSTTARTNMGVAIGTDVQAHAARLDTIVATGLDTSMFAAGVIDTDGTLAANSNLKIAPQAAVKNYIDTKVAALVSSAPGTLDTLNEIATALGDDPSFATTMTASLGNRLRVDAAQGLSGPQQVQGRANLGVVIGTNVQAWNARLDTISATGITAGMFDAGAIDTTVTLTSNSDNAFATTKAIRAYVTNAVPTTVPWGSLTGVPTTFPPSAHTHPISDVVGLQTALDGKLSLAGGTVTGATTFNALTSFGAGVAITGNSTAGAFIPNASTVPVNGLYLSAANTVGIAANSTNVVNFTNGGTTFGAPTGSFKGAGTLNVEALYVNGNNIVANTNFIYVKESWAATGATHTLTDGQTSFAINYSVGYVDVVQNGATLDTSQFSATDGTHVVLGTPASILDTIEIRAWSAVNITTPVYSNTVTFADGATWSAANGVAGLTKIGIGTASPANILDVVQSGTNGDAFAKLTNTNAGNAARSIFYAYNGTSGGTFQHTGTGYSPSSIYRADGTLVLGNGVGGLTLGTTSAQPVYFAVNNTEVAHFGTDGCLNVGTTGGWWPGTGVNNVRGYFQGVNYALGVYATATGFGGSAMDVRVDSTTMALVNWRYNTSVVGSISTNSTATSYNTTSDETLKNFDVEQRDFAAIIDALMVKDAEYLAAPGDRVLSVSAQQTAQIGFWDAVTPPDYDNPESKWNAEYGRFGLLSLWGVKNLRARVASLEERNSALKAENGDLRRSLSAIEERLAKLETA
jgi:hypothetical protein